MTKVTTGPAILITSTSCFVSGTIEKGERNIIQHGHCWSTKANPETDDSKTQKGSRSSFGSFISVLTGLNANTTYHVRAYAVDDEGTTYGNEISFTTLPYAVPSVTTFSVSNTTTNSATSGGNVTDDGGDTNTERGVCWSTSLNPTVANNHTIDSIGVGPFTSSIIGLTPCTTYHVRAYAKNSLGISYGNDIQFTTSPVLPTITTTAIYVITTTTASSGGNVTGDCAATVTSRGVCWSTNQSPTIVDSHTTDGSGTGSFFSILTELKSNTIYYVRAYATNSAGTAYGNEESFITENVIDINGNTYDIVQIGTQLWMQENLKTTSFNDASEIPGITDTTAWSNLTTPGYCWYNNDEATYKNTYGALYNWYTVNTGKLCPTGWHVPSDAEWTVLTDYLGGESVAGGNMKETGTIHWESPNTGATNESYFAALPGGYRDIKGTFSAIGYIGGWWSSTEHSIKSAWFRDMDYSFSDIHRVATEKENGLSVRCIRD